MSTVFGTTFKSGKYPVRIGGAQQICANKQITIVEHLDDDVTCLKPPEPCGQQFKLL